MGSTREYRFRIQRAQLARSLKRFTPPTACRFAKGNKRREGTTTYNSSTVDGGLPIPPVVPVAPRVRGILNSHGDRLGKPAPPKAGSQCQAFGWYPEKLHGLDEPQIVRPFFSGENVFSVLPEVFEDDCHRSYLLDRFIRDSVRQLRIDFGVEPVRPFPKRLTITCGHLRSMLEGMYDDIPDIVKLSIKTSQKFEDRFCTPCADAYESPTLRRWRKARFQDQPVDPEHLSRFAKFFEMNVEKGWNRRPFPYVPNGHATLFHGRALGGNWNKEEFEDWCRPTVVISSGKPRVVTLYSEFNTRVLTPLHLSLYSSLRKKGWLLVGEPENHHVNSLNGEGDFVSVDYSAATDNIKVEYVAAACRALINRAEGLSTDEIRCLEVLGALKIHRGGPVATRGQPMGSVMSFPVLCLINKTLQDMALVDLLDEKKISMKECSRHRCLINGDDALTRSPVFGLDYRPYLARHSDQLGMVLNYEKCMTSPCKAEINSTLFCPENPPEQSPTAGGTGPGGEEAPVFSTGLRLVKSVKSNVSACRMRPEVSDVLGFAAQASPTVPGFVRLAAKNSRILAKQPDKFLYTLDESRRRAVLSDSRLVRALSRSPVAVKPSEPGLIKMSPRPEGYHLDREEEVRTLNAEVAEIRRSRPAGPSRPPPCKSCEVRLQIVRLALGWRSQTALFGLRLGECNPVDHNYDSCDHDEHCLHWRTGFEKKRKKFSTVSVPNPDWARQVLRRFVGKDKQELIPACYARAFERKKKLLMCQEDQHRGVSVLPPVLVCSVDQKGTVRTPSLANQMVDALRQFKKRRRLAPDSPFYIHSIMEEARLPGTISSGDEFSPFPSFGG